MNTAFAKQTTIAAAAAILMIVSAGCQIDNRNQDTPAASKVDHSVSGDSPAETEGFGSQMDHDSKDQTDTTDKNATSPDAKTESTTGPVIPVPTEKWDSQAPKLHGIAIGESKSLLDRKLGKPVDTYTLDEDDDNDEALTVAEYAAFSVGYSSDKKVAFIEVFDKHAATGLNGIRVNDGENEAIKALGKPDTHTSSVIAYEAKEALLKLDLDPQNHNIVSIKLFST